MLKLTAVSVNHRTASVDARERIYYNSEEIRRVSEKLRSVARESLIVSTCNRTELYLVPYHEPLTNSDLYEMVRQAKGLHDGEFHARYETFEGFEAIRHLFTVATGADSLMVGDIQILGQVKDAYNVGVELGTVGTVLHHASQVALKVGKRAKSETKISEGAVSVSYAAVELAQKVFGNLGGRTAMLIGAGETAELAAKDLKSKEIGKLLIANRTIERAQNLIAEMGMGEAIPLDAMTAHLPSVDIVVSSVAGNDYILNREMVGAAMKGRPDRPLLIIDIGLPRNVDPNVRKVTNVFLNDMDSLNLIVEKNMQMRRSEIPAVNRIVDQELNDFIKWHSSLEVGPTIKMLREKIEQLRVEEIERYKGKLNGSDRQVIDEITKSLVNKILHEPMTNLKAAENGVSMVDRVKLVKALFGLSESDTDSDEDLPQSRSGKE